jgi:hypothetical protein
MDELTVQSEITQPRELPLTARDRDILEASYEVDGMLGARQISRLFFKGVWRTTRGRLSKLYKSGFVDRPDRRTRMSLPEMVYWLSPRGARLVAEQNGIPFEEFQWVKNPRLDRVPHHLPLGDLRIRVMETCEQTPDLRLLSWTGQAPFAQHTDIVEFRDTKGKLRRRYIEPDGLFIVYNEATDITARCLLEYDRGTKDGVAIVNEKVLPGLAYLNSQHYFLRTGYHSGRWLFVVHSKDSELRLRYLKRTIEYAAKQYARFFWFTTYEAAMNASNLILDKIWYRGAQRPPGRAGQRQSILKEQLVPMSLMLPRSDSSE